ncbi:S-adenosyl methyltransferase [Frankia torreyi]|uniref:S-adenosyl methyltransferase n=1 Tax=Frankia torreyi TaxID=1856 RepID=A0A0D8B6G3_9ACTN|nr:S-adenosyl methyltransferase [Frankia torreyi]KQM02216.1 S-adenosyl methyltransferase [Frankia sp. CpI1-P]
MTSTDPHGTPGTWWKTKADMRNPVDLKTDQPHSARMYDYYLGGKDHFPVDRDAAERTLAVFPNARIAAQANRAFMIRTTRHLAAQAGIRQFLDIGTGIPTSPNLHEAAQGIAPDARVVYADNDPMVPGSVHGVEGRDPHRQRGWDSGRARRRIRQGVHG